MKEFDSLASFARHLVRTAAVGEAVSNHIVKEAADVILHDAQARIGVYQDGIGGFSAWANLADSTVLDRVSKGFSPDEPLLRTGELRDSYEAQATGAEAVIGTPDIVALYQENGTSTIPPRPVLGPAAMASKEAVSTKAGAIVLAWLSGTPWKRLSRSGPALPSK